MTENAVANRATPAPAAADAARTWSLVGCLGHAAGLSNITIGKVPFTVGRAANNDLALRSKSVSKSHAQIIAAVDAVLIQDLGSTNGTFVNGKPIAKPTPVGDGDLVQFADMEFRLARASLASIDRTAVAEHIEEGWLISRVHEFINRERFHMAYQPIVSAAGWRTVGVEALVRCEVPGLESPIVLFEAASRLGLEKRISTMCRIDAVRSLAGRFPGYQLFLNTHPGEYLGRELVQSLAQLRFLAGDRPLVLEIHEATMPEMTAMRDFRQALRDLGIGLAYDDFGVGQSRLLELTEVPPDYLKFDRSLVRDEALASPGHRALLRTLLKHAADGGIATIAEGVETQAAVDACLALGFTHFQGYHFGRPVPVDALPS